MRSIAVINQKGGCGKTITAINLSAFLAEEHRKVLLIDMDPQGHATLGLLADPARPSKTMTDVLLSEGSAERIGIRDMVCSISANLQLASSDILLSSVPEKLSASHGRELRLAEAIHQLDDEYDYVIVDCPPGVGLLTFNALMACEEAIIPLDPSFFSLHGIGKLLETLDLVERKTGRKIEARALVTLYTGRSEFQREVVADLRRHLGDRTFETIIRYSTKLAEAASHGVPISKYCQRCVGFEDYQGLTKEVLKQEIARPCAGRRSEEGASVPSAPMTIAEGVLFTLRAPEAKRVQLAGDFNAWTPDEDAMQFANGVWRKILSLAPGRYRYRYVIDGRWESDPMNSATEPSPFGDRNSVVVVQDNKIAEP